MKEQVSLAIDREFLKEWESVKAEYYRRELKPPSMSSLFNRKCVEILIELRASLQDRKAVNFLRRMQRRAERREEMSNILRDASLERYNQRMFSVLLALRGEKHPDVARFRLLQRQEMCDRGERKAARRAGKRRGPGVYEVKTKHLKREDGKA